MIQESEFYHGAAVLRLIADERCRNVRPHPLGVLVNGTDVTLLKHSKRKRPPWRFTVTRGEWDEIAALKTPLHLRGVALICGGDGVCAITGEELHHLVGGRPGWIAVRRGHHERYAVTGAIADLERKITAQRWPDLLFPTEPQ